MVNKTPFEIRAELLSQAQNILSEKRYAQFVVLENDWMLEREEWSMKAGKGEFGDRPKYPSMPAVTTEEVVEEAKKLNDFVSHSG
jgi:hypothetical protein